MMQSIISHVSGLVRKKTADWKGMKLLKDLNADILMSS